MENLNRWLTAAKRTKFIDEVTPGMEGGFHTYLISRGSKSLIIKANAKEAILIPQNTDKIIHIVSNDVERVLVNKISQIISGCNPKYGTILNPVSQIKIVASSADIENGEILHNVFLLAENEGVFTVFIKFANDWVKLKDFERYIEATFFCDILKDTLNNGIVEDVSVSEEFDIPLGEEVSLDDITSNIKAHVVFADGAGRKYISSCECVKTTLKLNELCVNSNADPTLLLMPGLFPEEGQETIISTGKITNGKNLLLEKFIKMEKINSSPRWTTCFDNVKEVFLSRAAAEAYVQKHLKNTINAPDMKQLVSNYLLFPKSQMVPKMGYKMMEDEIISALDRSSLEMMNSHLYGQQTPDRLHAVKRGVLLSSGVPTNVVSLDLEAKTIESLEDAFSDKRFKAEFRTAIVGIDGLTIINLLKEINIPDTDITKLQAAFLDGRISIEDFQSKETEGDFFNSSDEITLSMNDNEIIASTVNKKDKISFFGKSNTVPISKIKDFYECYGLTSGSRIVLKPGSENFTTIRDVLSKAKWKLTHLPMIHSATSLETTNFKEISSRFNLKNIPNLFKVETLIVSLKKII